MKKIFFYVFLLTTITVVSQEKNIKFGVQAGLNYSNLRGYTIPSQYNALYNESPAFAYLIGFNAEYQLKNRLSLRAELSYERKTQKADNVIELWQSFEEPSQTYRFVSKKHYDYLVLPILVKYRFTTKNSLYMNGGPFLGYLLKSKLTNDLNAPGVANEDVDTTSDNQKTDFGVSFGFGKEISVSQKSAISIEIRDNLGLSNTSKIDVWNGGTVKTNSLNLLVSYSF